MVRAELGAADESRFFDRRTSRAAGCRLGNATKRAARVEPEIEARPIVTVRGRSGRQAKAAGITTPAFNRNTARLGIRLSADFLFDAEEVAAARTVLRREHADAATVPDLIDRVEHVDDIKAHRHRLMVRHGEVARHADIELGIRRQRVDIGVAGAKPRAVDHIGRERRVIPFVRQPRRAGHVLVMVSVSPVRREVLKLSQPAEIRKRSGVVEQELVRDRLGRFLLRHCQIGIGLEITVAEFCRELDALRDAFGVIEAAEDEGLAELAVVEQVSCDLIVTVDTEIERAAVFGDRRRTSEQELLVEPGVEIMRALRQ